MRSMLFLRGYSNSFKLRMSDNPTQLVQKLWNYCNILRDDGLPCGDYVEQLTFSLFLKKLWGRNAESVG